MPLRLVVLSLLGLAACDTNAEEVPDLGDPYTVEPAPLLNRDLLVVPVSYAGGCETHTFDLRYRTLAESVDLWLHHDANGDLCEALVSDTVIAQLPEAVRNLPPWLYVTETERVPLPQLRAD